MRYSWVKFVLGGKVSAPICRTVRRESAFGAAPNPGVSLNEMLSITHLLSSPNRGFNPIFARDPLS